MYRFSMVLILAACTSTQTAEETSAAAALSEAADQVLERPADRRGPPQEATEACAGLAADAACTFTIEDHTLTGVCGTPRDSETLACRPNPPQEAIDACVGLEVGADCVVGEDVSGVCSARKEDDATVFCAPPHRGRGPGHGRGEGERRGPPQEALDACAALAADAECSFTLEDQTLTGTCRTGPDGQGALACAPPRPEGLPPPRH